jgi:polysaccharide pyruvyl transferase WcaK-like protein
MGVDTSSDEVYPDLAFALPTPPAGKTSTGVVGIGVMSYHGRNEDRATATEIHTHYVSAVNGLVRWLVDRGTRVRLFTGDPGDEPVVASIIDDLHTHRPGLEPGWVTAEPSEELWSLMRKMTEVDVIVATRYHNVLCALKTSTPTISIGYATKHDVLMDSMGLGEFAESARSLDPGRLIERFAELESRSGELRQILRERNGLNAGLLERQFAALSTALLSTRDSATSAPGRRGAAT